MFHSSTKPSILIWGAGKIGRGFVADLFQAAGYRLVLVDAAQALIDDLNRAGRYTVVRASAPDRRQDVVIEGFTALATGQRDDVNAAVMAADLLALALFPQHFEAAANQLAPAIAARLAARPAAALDILLCTNLAHAGPQFRRLLWESLPPDARRAAEDRLGIVETLVIRIAAEAPSDLRRSEPLLVWTNGYPDLFVDRLAFKGTLPQVAGLRPVEDMRAAEIRKLYTYNTFQSALAFFGWRRGYATAVECLADERVRALAEGVLAEASQALQAEFSFSATEMAAWNAGLIEQTNNPLLGDKVERLAADPLRKLKRDDRLVGPLLLARKHGLAHDYLVQAVAAALRYDAPADLAARQCQREIAEAGLRAAIGRLCGLEGEEDLIDAIASAYDNLPQEETWAERAQRAYRLGFEYERIYHGCGQCTLAAVLGALDRFPLEAPSQEERAFEAATALAGGIGLAGEGAPCGALMGAVLAFGLVSPRRREHFDEDRENKYRAFSMAQRMRERYLAAYGGITCHEIHRHELGRPFDLRDKAEREAFEAAGAHDDKCTGVVARAAQWAIEIIAAEAPSAIFAGK